MGHSGVQSASSNFRGSKLSKVWFRSKARSAKSTRPKLINFICLFSFDKQNAFAFLTGNQKMITTAIAKKIKKIKDFLQPTFAGHFCVQMAFHGLCALHLCASAARLPPIWRRPRRWPFWRFTARSLISKLEILIAGALVQRFSCIFGRAFFIGAALPRSLHRGFLSERSLRRGFLAELSPGETLPLRFAALATIRIIISYNF